MAKAAPEKVSFRDRLKQIWMAFRFTAKHDRLFLPLFILAVVAAVGLTAGIVWLTGQWLWSPVGILLVLLAGLIVLNLRANTAMLKEAEGQIGASLVILKTMRGDWRVTEAVQLTTQNDFVHRVIGRPGIVLVAEGQPGRVRGLLGAEKRRLAKVVGDTPIYDYVVGNEDGQMPLKRLRNELIKLPRNVTGKQVNALDQRLSALSARPAMPKGPVPKNMRPPKGARNALRGR